MGLEALRTYFASSKSKELRGHKGKVLCLGWSCDGRRLASGSADQTIRIWSSSAGGEGGCVELTGHGGSVDQLAWSPTQADVLASTGSDRTLRIWQGGQVACKVSVPGDAAGLNLCWDPDGTRIAIGSKNDWVALVEAKTGAVLWKKRYAQEINQIAWLDAQELLLTTGTGDVLIVDFARGRERALPAHTANCYCIKKRGDVMAVGGADAVVTLWSASHLACTAAMARLDWPIRTLDLSHDGLLLAAGSEDAVVEVALVEGGEQVARVPVGAPVNAVAWHPTKYLLAYAADETDPRTNRAQGNLHIFS